MGAESAEVYSVYAVVGAERFLRNDALDGILKTLVDETDSYGPTRVDGIKGTLAEVLDEVRTPSLLGGRRTVIVEDADPFISANREALERYCGAAADCGSLILLCNTMARNTRIYRAISKCGKVVSCEAPKGRAVNGWIANRAQGRYGKRLATNGAAMLRDHLGDGLGVLDAELAKLATYVGEREQITPADIDALTGRHREEKVFGVTDAMSSGDTATALSLWEQVLATDRAAPGRAVAGLAWSVRRLLEARRDWDQGVTMRELANRLFTDSVVLQRRLERVTVGQLEAQQQDLLAVDLAIKTGASTVELAVEKFIVKHSARGKTGR